MIAFLLLCLINTGWLLVAFLELGLAAGLILWWLNHLGWLK